MGVVGGFGPVGDAELGDDSGDVHAGGLRRYRQFGCDLLVGVAERDQTQHFDFASR